MAGDTQLFASRRRIATKRPAPIKAVPPEIMELWQEWPELDPQTARLIRAAVMSRDSQRLRRAWQLLAARADLMQMLQASGC